MPADAGISPALAENRRAGGAAPKKTEINSNRCAIPRDMVK
jgi:hypothetical protein